MTTTNGRYTTAASKPDMRVGEVRAGEWTVAVLDVNITESLRGRPDEVLVRVNGRILRRMHPEAARRLGILRIED